MSSEQCPKHFKSLGPETRYTRLRLVFNEGDTLSESLYYVQIKVSFWYFGRYSARTWKQIV